MKQTKRVLSVVLALAMVFAMSIMVSAATPVCKTSMVKNADGTITVKLLGTGADLQNFDYGIAYDSKNMEVVNYVDPESGDESAAQWSDRMKSCAMRDANNQGNYVVIGGSHTKEFVVKDGVEIATVTFKVTGDADATSIVVVNDSALIVGEKDPATFTVDDFKATTAEGVKPVETPVKDIPTPAPEATPTPEAPVVTETAPTVVVVETPATATPAPTASAKAPKTADTASVVVPVVAIVAAAAAVVVVSKKRVEE